jgi:hypothetical protein
MTFNYKVAENSTLIVPSFLCICTEKQKRKNSIKIRAYSNPFGLLSITILSNLHRRRDSSEGYLVFD